MKNEQTGGKQLTTDNLKQFCLTSQQLFENRINCEWLSTNEAARYLSITANALRIMVYRNQIKTYKLGSRLRFRAGDCQALFKQKGAFYGNI
jgi:excisionase family DNA binding protein